MAAKPADQRFVRRVLSNFFTAMPAIRAKNIDIQFSFGDINTDEVGSFSIVKPTCKYGLPVKAGP